MYVGAIQGPTLRSGERHWPIGWEQTPGIDECHHIWEHVLITTPDGSGNEVVIRCRECHVPRCGDSGDSDPCMYRRHHRGAHRLFSQWIPDLSDPEAVEKWLESA